MADKLQELFDIVFDTSGAEGVDKLVAVLRQLSDTGGDADAKLSPLADELERIGETKAAIQTLTSTKAALAETTADIEKTQQQLQALNVVMLDPKASAAFTKQSDAAQAALSRLTAQEKEQQLQLAKAQGVIAKSGLDTHNLAAANEELGARAANVARQAQLIVPALQQSGAAAKETAAGFQEIVERSSFLSRVVEQVKALVAVVGGLFALDKAKEAIEDVVAEGDKIARLRGQFEAAFGGVAEGADALERINALAQNLPLSLDDVQAAAIRAKKQGLDPFDGTLESLIASNAKFGGDVNSLNARIDLLGKATQRGTLTLKDLVALQQEGIPASQLLGDALGKTSDEILDLAKSGQLGRNSISTLIDALGRSGAADAAGEMGLLSTLVVKVKDQWQDFLGIIAESGAYDFVKQQLSAINTALRTGLADGSLKAAAQGISDTIVGIGKAIVGTTKFIADHATAIGAVIKTYVLFKGTLLTLDLAQAAARFASLGAATAGAEGAAAAAAAEKGGFGKLTARLGAIPKNIQIALATLGVDFALGQIEKLISVTQEYYAVQQQQKDIDADIAAQRGQLATKAAAVAAVLKQAADVQIASEDALANKNAQQSRLYIEQLQNATRYYNALRIQADQAGNSTASAAATAKLRELGAAIKDAQARLQNLNTSFASTSEAVAGVVNHFDEVKSSGTSAAEAIAGAFEHIEINTPQGINDVLAIVQQVSIRSHEASTAVQSELVRALADLNEADLRNFQNNVTQRLVDAKGKADELKIALGAALQASLLKLGLSAQQAGIEISKTGEDLIATFDDIARNATASSQQVQLAFAAALSKASTEGEVSALQDQLTQAFNAGVITADQFGAASEAAGRKVAEIKAAAIEASAGLDGMGTAGETNAQRISAALQDARDQLVVQADGIAKAINDALASGDQAGADALRAQFKGVDAELQALNDRIAQVGDNLQNVGRTRVQSPDFSGFKRGFESGTESVGQFESGVEGVTFANQEAADAFEELGGSAGSTGNLLGQLQNEYTEFASVSTAAVEKFSKTLVELFNGTGNFSQQALTDGTNIIRAGEAAGQAAKLVRDEIDQQRQSLAAYADQIQNLSDDQLRQKGSADAVAESLRGDAAAAREGKSAYDLLGKADLAPLAAALDAAAAKVEQLKEKAIEAKGEISDIGSSIQDQIDQANGNDLAIEQRRFLKQLDDLKTLAEQSGNLNSAEYRDTVEKAKQLHAINMANIQAEIAAKQQGNNQSGAAAGGGTTTGGPGGGDFAGGGGIKQTIDFNVNGTNLKNVDPDDPAFQKKVTDIVLAQIKRAARGTGNFASG